MKKLLFISMICIGLGAGFTACGGGEAGKGTDSTGTKENSSGPAETPAASGKAEAFFGGNLFWGVTTNTTVEEASKLSPPNSDKNHDEKRGRYSWYHDDAETGLQWGLSLEFNDAKKVSKVEFYYDPKKVDESRAFGMELLSKIEAKYGKHTNEDSAEDTNFEWESDGYSAYLNVPSKDGKETELTYATELKK